MIRFIEGFKRASMKAIERDIMTVLPVVAPTGTCLKAMTTLTIVGSRTVFGRDTIKDLIGVKLGVRPSRANRPCHLRIGHRRLPNNTSSRRS